MTDTDGDRHLPRSTPAVHYRIDEEPTAPPTLEQLLNARPTPFPNIDELRARGDQHELADPGLDLDGSAEVRPSGEPCSALPAPPEE